MVSWRAVATTRSGVSVVCWDCSKSSISSCGDHAVALPGADGGAEADVSDLVGDHVADREMSVERLGHLFVYAAHESAAGTERSEGDHSDLRRAPPGMSRSCLRGCWSP